MRVINHIELRDGRGYIRGANKKAEMIARMYACAEEICRKIY